MRAEEVPNSSTLVAFTGAVLIGGGNFVAVKFSNEELEPFFGAGVRFSAAAVILIFIMLVTGLGIPNRSEFLGAVVYGVLGISVCYAGFYYSLVGLEAGTLAVFVASTPLITLVLAVLHRQERFTARGLFGGVLALAGITVISVGSLGGDLRPTYLAGALIGVVAVAESSVLVKGFPKAHPITTNAIGTAAGGLLLLLGSFAVGEEWLVPRHVNTWLVLTWLVVVGSVGLFALFLLVIRRWTASAAVYALTLMPVVAIPMGALLADEEITAQVLVGGGLVITAVYVGALSAQGKPLADAAPEVPPGAVRQAEADV